MVGVNPSVTPSVDPTPRASRAVASPFPSPPPSACAAHRKPPPPPPPRQPQTEKLPLKQSTRLPLPQRNLRPFFLLLLHPTKRKQESAPTQQSLLPASPEPAQHRILRPPLRFLNPAEPSIHCPTTNGRRGGSFRCPFSGVTNLPGPGPVPAIYPISLRFCVGKAPPTPTKPSNGAALSATRGRARRACRLAGAGTLVLPRLSLPASSWGGPNLHSVQFPPPPGKAGRYSTLACVWGFARCFPTVQSFAKFGRPRILVPLKLLAAPNLGVWEESSESWPPAPWLVRRRQKKKLPMEPPSSSRLWASLWTFIKFLPYFCGLFILGLIKGILLCPWACLIMAIGISALILGLWPMHLIWTYYCIIRTKMVGPVVKLLLLVAATVILILWLIIGIPGSVLAGLLYGFLAPIMATFDAVGEGKENTFVHCFVDGTWSTITGSCTVVRDLKDMLFHSYFSVMDDLRFQTPPGGKPYEIRLLDIPGALLSAACGLILDVIMFTLIAIYKCPVMLFKGWKRLIQDLIGREGPFLETACVPFAGLAILLWPFAVLGAVLASILSSIPLGMYGAVVAYQESSVVMGLSYAVSSVSIFDEYTNDVLDMAPGSCFPKLKYRKQQNEDSSHGGHLSKPVSFDKENQEGKKPLARVTSFKNSMDEFNPFKMLDHLFAECKRQGEVLVNEGLITMKDIQETKSGKVGSGVLNVGLPAYVILNALLRSAKSNSNGLILSDGAEITSDNRPKSTLFDWFFDPLMIIKEQIKAENFTEEEEEYLKMRVLMVGEPSNLKGTLPHVPSLNERKKAEIDAFARRLQGITKSISRYPTSKRRFDVLVKSLLSELERTMGGSVPANGSQALRLRGGIARMLSQKSIGKTANIMDEDPEAQVTRKARTP